MATSETLPYRADKRTAPAHTSPVRHERRGGRVHSWLSGFSPNGRLGRLNLIVAGAGMGIIVLGFMAWTAIAGYLDLAPLWRHLAWTGAIALALLALAGGTAF